MDLGIAGRTALVLGGSGGLGSAIAVALAREGVKVAVGARTAEKAGPTVSLITMAGGMAIAAPFDITDLASGHRAIDEIERLSGPVDILFNNTGGPKPSTAAGQPPQSWNEAFAAFVLPVVALTDRLLPGMRERKWGRIITSTSSGVISPIPNLALSNALRSALVGWSKTLSREVAREGITVNVVVPGRIATRRITFLNEQKAGREGRSVEDVASESASTIAMGRYGDPEEYAAAVAFLASARASYITGTMLRVDGGLIASV
jgi:3-oxoacyl-[acyl-carrier protein] reductase